MVAPAHMGRRMWMGCIWVVDRGIPSRDLLSKEKWGFTFSLWVSKQTYQNGFVKICNPTAQKPWVKIEVVGGDFRTPGSPTSQSCHCLAMALVAAPFPQSGPGPWLCLWVTWLLLGVCSAPAQFRSCLEVML